MESRDRGPGPWPPLFLAGDMLQRVDGQLQPHVECLGSPLRKVGGFLLKRSSLRVTGNPTALLLNKKNKSIYTG